MSNQLIGQVKGTYSHVSNRNSIIMDVPLTIPSYKNRATEASRIEGYLKKAGGWDEALAGCISVARLPNGNLIRYDGDHRTHMKKITSPNSTTIKAVVVDVSSYEEISELFKTVNYSGRKNLRAEDLFIHNPDPKVVQQLTNVGVKIDIGTGEQDTVVGDLNGPKTTIQNFKKGIQFFGEDCMKKANYSIISCTNEKPTEYPSELLSGIACVFKYLKLSSSEEKLFQNWLKETVNYRSGSLHKVHSIFKKKGGSVNNKGSFSVARGLLEEWYNTIPQSSKKTLKGKINQSMAKIAYELELEN